MRLQDLSIKARLYTLVFLTAIGFTTVLGVNKWLSAKYQVNGPLYEHLMTRRVIQAEYEPATLAIIEPKLTINTMLIAKDPDEVRQLVDQFRRLEEQIHRFRATGSFTVPMEIGLSEKNADLDLSLIHI